jgi:hypothetical protein
MWDIDMSYGDIKKISDFNMLYSFMKKRPQDFSCDEAKALLEMSKDPTDKRSPCMKNFKLLFCGMILATIEKNKTTMCSMKSIGNITRYQVFSSRGGKDFFETYTYPDVCVDKFLELTK